MYVIGICSTSGEDTSVVSEVLVQYAWEVLDVALVILLLLRHPTMNPALRERNTNCLTAILVLRKRIVKVIVVIKVAVVGVEEAVVELQVVKMAVMVMSKVVEVATVVVAVVVVAAVVVAVVMAVTLQAILPLAVVLP